MTFCNGFISFTEIHVFRIWTEIRKFMNHELLYFFPLLDSCATYCTAGGGSCNVTHFTTPNPFIHSPYREINPKNICQTHTGLWAPFFLLLRPNSCPTSSWVKHTRRRQHDRLAAGSCNQLTRAGTIPKRPTSQHLNIPPSTKKFLSCLLIEVSDAGSWHGAQCNTASCKLPASDTPIYKQQGNLRPWCPRLQVTKDEGLHSNHKQAWTCNIHESWTRFLYMVPCT